MADVLMRQMVSLDDCLVGPTSATEAWSGSSDREKPPKKNKHVKQKAHKSWEDGIMTVMIRQIPRHYTQLMFLAEMSCCGFKGLVDFMYFPFDRKKRTNVGYGFVNFIEPQHAWAFAQEFDNTYLDMAMKTKDQPLRIHPAALQGYEE